MIRLAFVFLLASVLPVYSQTSQEVSVFGSDCSSTSLSIPPGSGATLKVCAHLNGNQPDPERCLDPVLAVRCRIVGIPGSWAVSAVPNPDATYLTGDPVAAGGGRSPFRSTAPPCSSSTP